LDLRRTNSETEIFTDTGSGAVAVRVTTNACVEEWPALSADGQRLAFFDGDGYGPSSVYVAQRAGPVRKLLTPPYVDCIRWSPDGRRLVVDGRVVDTVSGSSVVLDDYHAVYDCPTWSSDGMTISFVASQELTSYIFDCDARTGTVARRTKLWASIEHVALSPNRLRVAYISTRYAPDPSLLYVAETSGRRPRQLADLGAGYWRQYLAWSADGRYLVTTPQEPDGHRVVVRVDVEDLPAR
jgi:Tol biopolymer transport system component